MSVGDTSVRDLGIELEQRAIIRAFLDAASQGIIAVNQSGVIVLANARAHEMFGYAPGELIGQRHEVLLPEHLRDIHVNHEAEYFRHPRTRPMGVGLDLRGHKKDGTEFDIEISLSHVQEGGHRLAFAFISDITERKRMEEAERRRQAQKLESIGVLAGGIAHDFNNLMAAVLGNASLALDILPPGHPARPLLESITSASERAAHLTGQLLAYAGKARFVLQPTDLSSVVRDVMNLVQASIPRTVHVQLQLDDRLPPVESDPAQLQQLVTNLVLNAMEAIPEGRPGLVRVATGLEHVSRDDLQKAIVPGEVFSGEFVVLRVEDMGVGMSSEMVSKIFDPFFTTKFMGRGLGLAAVLGIVRAHKGALTVQTALGRGTRFTVLLPPANRHPEA